ncbi:MAG: OsmC family peroxiredoxin [Myxococcales bacterium]|nr:OsmC family peroxiredoxin [Myxococcales bacterium]
MGVSKASATWDGTIKQGRGAMKPDHAAEIPFSFSSRFEGQAASNPEEVVGAALAGCFSMALSLGLEKAGHPPKSIRTSASVHLNRDGDGFKIDKIELTTRASVPGLDADRFTAIAEATKKACPVSKALAGVDSITLQASLEPESAA